MMADTKRKLEGQMDYAIKQNKYKGYHLLQVSSIDESSK